MNENATTTTLRRHEKYDRLIAAAKGKEAVATAVAHPCDETSLRGAIEAGEAGLDQAHPCRSQETRLRAVAESSRLDSATLKSSTCRTARPPPRKPSNWFAPAKRNC